MLSPSSHFGGSLVLYKKELNHNGDFLSSVLLGGSSWGHSQ